MRTDRRLTEAYNNGRVVEVDEASRVVIMSDQHRGTGSFADEFNRNQNTFLRALEFYYDAGFTYIEAGDGDELWEHPRFRDVKHAHYEVYESIKRFFDDDRLIVLYGNHNNLLKYPEYVRENLFTYYSDYRGGYVDFMPGIQVHESVVLRVKGTGQEFLVVHGHQGDYPNDQGWRLTALSMKWFWGHLHSIGITNPVSPSANAFKAHDLEKRYTQWIEKHRTALICGHTHRCRYPRGDEPPYFNTGCCVYPMHLTALEIIEGTIALARWRVFPGEGGFLEVRRDVTRGPEPLASFDIR